MKSGYGLEGTPDIPRRHRPAEGARQLRQKHGTAAAHALQLGAFGMDFDDDGRIDLFASSLALIELHNDTEALSYFRPIFTPMNIHSDYAQRVVLLHQDWPWIASPETSIERRMLDRIDGEIASASPLFATSRVHGSRHTCMNWAKRSWSRKVFQ